MNQVAREDRSAARAPGRGRPLALWSFLEQHEGWLVMLAGPVLVLPEWFQLRLGGAVGSWRALPLELAAAAWIGLLWLARYRVRGRWSSRTGLDGPILALLLTVPAACVVARDSVAAISRACSLLFAVALYYALANAVSTPRRAWLATACLLVAGLGVSAVALVSVDWTAKVLALAPILSGLPRWIDEVPHATLAGAGVHPNTVGGLAGVVGILAAALLWWPRGDRAPETAAPSYVRPLALATLLTCAGLLLLSQSRGAWLAVATSGGLLVAGRRRWPWWGALAATSLVAVGALGALGVALPRATGWPLVDQAGTTLAARRELWRQALELLAEQPGTGIGLNNFPLVHGQRPEYEGSFVYQGFPHAHNTLLQAGLDYGVPGMVAVVGLMSGVAWMVWRGQRRLRGSPLAPLVMGLGLGLLVYALHGTLDAIAIGAKPGCLVWAMAGVLAGVRHQAHRWVPRPPRLEPSGGHGGDAMGATEAAEVAKPSVQW